MMVFSPLVCLLHPWGLEDAVRRDVKHTGTLSPNLKLCRGDCGVAHLSPCGVRGVCTLHCEPVSLTHSSSSTDDVYYRDVSAAVFDVLWRLRTVDAVGVWLFSAPCVDSFEQLDSEFARSKESVKLAVCTYLYQLRAAALHRSDDVVLFLSKAFHRAIGMDDEILFRVNAVRRDKSAKGSFSSQDLAQHVGDLIYTEFSGDDGSGDLRTPPRWRVDLMNYNVEFVVVHDKDTAHVFASMHPPNVPRCGSDIHPVDAVARELLRQNMSASLAQRLTSARVGQVSRPSHFKHELRVTKGDNAMHPAIASALVALSDARAGDVLLDPLCGCGTILMEAVLRHGEQLLVVGGDLKGDDAVRATTNLLGMRDACWIHRLRRGGGGAASSSTAAWQQELLQLAQPANVVSWSTESTAFAWQPEVYNKCFQLIATEMERASRPSPTFTTFQWDAVKLPLNSNSVDVIVSDLPFGRRCGTHGINAKTYPRLLREFHRVLRKPSAKPSSESMRHREGEASHADDDVVPWWTRRKFPAGELVGRCVLLTIEGKVMRQALEQTQHDCPFVLLREPFAVDMGGLCPYVFVLDVGAPPETERSQ